MTATTRVAKRETPVWVAATGTPKTRIKKATHYLKNRAWVPSDPRDGDKAMLVILCNLRRYHQLCAATAVMLIQNHYNPRCITSAGIEWGWDKQDILKKYRQAGKRGLYPTLGVSDPKAKVLASKLQLHRQLKAFWKKCIIQGTGKITPAEMRDAFVRYRDGEDVTPNMLSRAIKIVIGVEPVRPFGEKFYRGFRIAETHLGLTNKRTKPAQVA